MEEILGHLEIKHPQVIYRQISDFLRSKILDGTIARGSKLPATSELSKVWGVPVATIQVAMTMLVKEGLLERRPKKGTYVKERKKKLETVAIVEWTDAGAERFRTSVNGKLKNLAEQRGLKWVNFRDVDIFSVDVAESPTRGGDSADSLGFDALVGAGIAPDRLARLVRLPVPTAFQCTTRAAGCIDLDHRQFVTMALDRLALKGVKSVGVLTHLFPPSPDQQASIPQNAFMIEFEKRASQAGMQVYPEWNLNASAVYGNKAHEPSGTEIETLGYQLFGKLWDQSRRPEALVAWPSTLARGVVTAILERRVEIPRDLRVVFARTAETPFICPFEADILQTSTTAIAEALLDSVLRQYEGEHVDFQILPYSLATED
jgi:DNA-binding transcriptional regulator YhcF (GntR family)/DNA-binding LacI/PurR family transcriptional regulator